MINRREFMSYSTALGILPLAGQAQAAQSIAWPKFYKVIYDDQFAAAKSFASRVQSFGANIRAIRGDITDLWFRDLYDRWRSGPTLIAGLTLESSAVQLGHFARDQQHTLRYQTHVIPDDSSFGQSHTTELMTESMTPARLVSWMIVPQART
ncbi:hypothetical protein [Candidatus Rariloculus sp.]|uniref:hypothetical protein n=1 Tax=Candidatus Rariloculus sp. TaxID=3101265 RepID=UPI003D0E4E59